jgi:putative phosphoribosyl transferase
MRRFHDRREAGQALARPLAALARNPATIVLALPRGGVPVAIEVARALELPLDLLCVRKIGAPLHKELALGAIAEGGACVRNEDVIRDFAIAQDEFEQLANRERQELERRVRTFRGNRAPLEVSGRTVVLVDDGLATGATMRAAIQSLKRASVKRVILAVPVAARDSLALLEPEVDQVVCLSIPSMFGAVGLWYEQFPQVSDGEVQTALKAFNTRSRKPSKSLSKT